MPAFLEARVGVAMGMMLSLLFLKPTVLRMVGSQWAVLLEVIVGQAAISRRPAFLEARVVVAMGLQVLLRLWFPESTVLEVLGFQWVRFLEVIVRPAETVHREGFLGTKGPKAEALLTLSLQEPTLKFCQKAAFLEATVEQV